MILNDRLISSTCLEKLSLRGELKSKFSNQSSNSQKLKFIYHWSSSCFSELIQNLFWFLVKILIKLSLEAFDLYYTKFISDLSFSSEIPSFLKKLVSKGLNRSDIGSYISKSKFTIQYFPCAIPNHYRVNSCCQFLQIETCSRPNLFGFEWSEISYDTKPFFF